jgi:hypothetical protein
MEYSGPMLDDAKYILNYYKVKYVKATAGTLFVHFSYTFDMEFGWHYPEPLHAYQYMFTGGTSVSVVYIRV